MQCSWPPCKGWQLGVYIWTGFHGHAPLATRCSRVAKVFDSILAVVFDRLSDLVYWRAQRRVCSSCFGGSPLTGVGCCTGKDKTSLTIWPSGPGGVSGCGVSACRRLLVDLHTCTCTWKVDAFVHVQQVFRNKIQILTRCDSARTFVLPRTVRGKRRARHCTTSQYVYAWLAVSGTRRSVGALGSKLSRVQ